MLPKDVREILPYVCGHRLILSGNARLHEQTAEKIRKRLDEIIA